MSAPDPYEAIKLREELNEKIRQLERKASELKVKYEKASWNVNRQILKAKREIDDIYPIG